MGQIWVGRFASLRYAESKAKTDWIPREHYLLDLTWDFTSETTTRTLMN